MQILKILYICWLIFWALGCILVGAIAYDDGRLGNVVFVFVILATMPFLLYVSSILLIKTFKKSKILFSLLFLILLAMYIILCLDSKENIAYCVTFIILHIIIALVKIGDDSK